MKILSQQIRDLINSVISVTDRNHWDAAYTHSQISGDTTIHHTHVNKVLLDSYNQTNANITDAVSKKHTHTNFGLLETYNIPNSNLSTAVTQTHTHTNKTLLDTLSGFTNASLLLAITNQHSHTNKALLDTLADFTNAELLSSIAAVHSHSNSVILDAITAAFTTTLKTNYDLAYTQSHTHGNKAVLDNLIQTVIDDSHTHSNKTLLDSIISSGDGSLFLADDGVYKVVSLNSAGANTQVLFNDGGSVAGNAAFTFNKITNLVTTSGIIGLDKVYTGDMNTYITKNVGNDLVFTDANSGSITLASLLSGTTNPWTVGTGYITYGTGTDKVGINTSSLNEALNVSGNIEANQFNSKYYRYNGNWLVGTNIGPSLLRTNVAAFDTLDTSTPLALFDFSNRVIELDGDTTIGSNKNLTVGNKTTTKYLALNTAPVIPSHEEGLVYWNTTRHTLDIMPDISGNILQVGQEMWVRVINSSGSTIPDGTPVYVTSASSDLIHIAPARANLESTSLTTLGLTNADIADNAEGFVTIIGGVHNLNTTSLTEGALVYVSPSVAGGLTTTRPVAPNTVVNVGICTVRDASVGVIQVRLTVQPTIERLSNVYISGITDQQVLSWDTVNSRWFNRSITATPPSDGIFDWSTTSNYYQPYSTQQPSLTFDSSTSYPLLTSRLNLNGNFYSTNLFSKSLGLAGSTSGTATLVAAAVAGTTTLTLPSTTGTLALTSDITASVPVNNIFKWDTVNKYYTPYADKTEAGGSSSAGKFYLGSTNPTADTRLNYDGILATTALRLIPTSSTVWGLNISVAGGLSGAIITSNYGYLELANGVNLLDFTSNYGQPDALRTLYFKPSVANASTAIAYYFGSFNNLTTSGAKLISVNNAGVEKAFIDKDGNVDIKGEYRVNGVPFTGGVAPTSGFLYWNATTSTYEPYASYTAGKLYLGTSDPTGTTRFNLDGHLVVPKFSTFSTGVAVAGTFLAENGYGLNVSTTGTGTVANLSQGGSVGNGSSILSMGRSISGTGSATGNFINIVDNPSTSGTISGKVLSATIGATERISLNPRVTSGSTDPAYLFDTFNSLGTSNDLLSIRTGGSERFKVHSSGYIDIYENTSNFSTSQYNYYSITYGGVIKTKLSPGVANVSSSIAYLFDTIDSLSVAGAKIASFKNQGTEKMSIDKDGNMEITSSSQGVILKSPDGTRYKITVANGGSLTVTAL